MTDRERIGRAAYEADCKAKPLYHDGAPRKPWEKLCEVARESWRATLECRPDKAALYR